MTGVRLRLDIDGNTRQAFLELRPDRPVMRFEETSDPSVTLCLDAEGTIVGIEISGLAVDDESTAAVQVLAAPAPLEFRVHQMTMKRFMRSPRLADPAQPGC